MELNEQAAIDRNLQDILSARTAREEAEILAEIESESEISDISEIDNGYSKITRAFFSAAHATKDNNESRQAELAVQESKEKSRDIFKSLTQDVIARNRAFQEEIYNGIQRNLDAARAELNYYDKVLGEIQEQKELLKTEVETFAEKVDDAAIVAEAVEKIKQEAKIEVEQAKELEATCTVAANAEVCKAELGMEGSTDAELHDRLKTGVETAEANEQEVAELARIANDNVAEAEQQMAAAESKLQSVEQIENETLQNKSRVEATAVALEAQQEKMDEFQKNLDADLKSGKITPEEAAQRSTEFSNSLRTQARTTNPTQAQPALAANTDTPNTARPTASAASTLNDGGGIKAGSISNQFASAASGTTTPAAPAMEPERQPVYASPSMAMG